MSVTWSCVYKMDMFVCLWRIFQLMVNMWTHLIYGIHVLVYMDTILSGNGETNLPH